MKIIYHTYNKHCYCVLTWSVLLLWLFLGVACTADDDSTGYSVDTEVKDVSINLSTRALGSGDEKINAIRVIVAKQDELGTIITNASATDPQNPLVIKTLSGLCDVFVIVNESETAGGFFPGFDNLKTIAELKTKSVAFNITKRKETNLPMIGVVRDVRIIPDSESSVSNPSKVQVGGVIYNELAVDVKRLAVKVNLVLKSKGYSDLETVRLTNIPDSVSLFGTYEKTSNRQNLDVTMVDTIPSLGYIWQKKAVNIIIPANVFVESSSNVNAMKLEVKVEGKDTKIASLGHYIETSYSKKDYTLHPNTWYTFTGRLGGDQLQIDAAIADWEFQNQSYPTGGGKWKTQPVSQRVGINDTDGGAVRFIAKFETTSPISYQWYRKCQTYNQSTNRIMTHVVEFTDINSDTLKIDGSTKDTLKITTKQINQSGEIFCVASTFSPDGTEERSESNYVTFMAVGENYEWPENSFPSLQKFKTPVNVPLGSTCILQDERDKKAYHVKLMADGNWWMIQDLAYGGTLPSWTRNMEVGILIPYVIAENTHGMAMKTGLSTGGHYYNTYATVQLSIATQNEYDTTKGVDKVYLNSICPSGWHLPGNYDNKFNQEWLDFRTKNGVDYDIISVFEYNTPTAFNAYTVTDNNNKRFRFAGGCAVVRPGGGDGTEYFYRTQGAFLGTLISIPIGTATDDVINVEQKDKIIIRCIKNFK